MDIGEIMLMVVQTVVIFGDPDNGKAVGSVSAAKTKVICHTGDNICAGGSMILQPHLTVSVYIRLIKDVS